jgi:hypothetical protein
MTVIPPLLIVEPDDGLGPAVATAIFVRTDANPLDRAGRRRAAGLPRVRLRLR